MSIPRIISVCLLVVTLLVGLCELRCYLEMKWAAQALQSWHEIDKQIAADHAIQPATRDAVKSGMDAADQHMKAADRFDQLVMVIRAFLTLVVLGFVMWLFKKHYDKASRAFAFGSLMMVLAYWFRHR